MAKRGKARTAPAHRSADSKDLPPGWIRVESRSKPGSYFYAHPATKRTQVEHPSKTQTRQSKNERPAGPRRKPADGGGEAMDVEEFEDPAERAERLKQETEEAEAAEAARQEMVRHQRAAKLALLREAPEGKKDDDSDEENEIVSKEELERWKETEERREREEAEAERRRKEEEERRRKEQEEAERRRLEEEERKRLEEERRKEEEQQRIEAEKIALWKHRVHMARKEAEFELAMAKERQKKDEADKALAKQLEAEKLRQALLESKKQEAEEEKKKAEAELRKKAEAERFKKEIAATHQKVLQIPEPSDEIAHPCFDVFKGGNRIGRFLLKPSQKSWLVGRAPVGVDFQLGHETISRKHAQVNRQGCFTFLQDLGSAHGTSLNGQKLTKNTLERLCSGDNLRLGGSARTYVYREPSTAIQINTRGVRLQTPGLSEQELPEPPLDSPKMAAGKPKIDINLASPKAAVAVRENSPAEPAMSPGAVPSQEAAARTQAVPEAEKQEAVLAALESLVATTAAASADMLGAPQDTAPKTSRRSSSSSSSSSAKRKRKASPKKKKKKSSSSSSSSKKRRKRQSKSKKRGSSSTSASKRKAKKKSSSSS